MVVRLCGRGDLRRALAQGVVLGGCPDEEVHGDPAVELPIAGNTG